MRRRVLPFLLLLALPAWAQGLVLEDDLVQLFEALPGQEIRGAISLRNSGKAPLSVRVEVADYRELQGFLPLGEAPRSLGGSLYLETPRLNLPPGERGSVRFTLRVPQDLEGTRYAYLLIAPEGPEPGGEGNVALRLEERYAVLVAASHGGRPEVRFLEAKGEGRYLVFLAENRGNRIYRPQARFQLLGREGVVREASLGTYTFLPGEPKRLSVELPPLPQGEYVALLFLDDGVFAYAGRVRLDVR